MIAPGRRAKRARLGSAGIIWLAENPMTRHFVETAKNLAAFFPD